MRRSAGAVRRFRTIATRMTSSASFKIICGFTIAAERSAATAQARLKELPSAIAALSIVLRAKNDLNGVGDFAYAPNRQLNVVFARLTVKEV